MPAVPAAILQAQPPSWLPQWMDWFYGVGRWVVDALSLSGDKLLLILLFVIVLIGSFMAGRLASLFLRRNVFRPPRVDAAVGRVLGHFVTFGFLLLGFSAGITLFGTDIAQIATGLGLLTLALGFGMQNLVANLVGGISLAFDKPFRPGDRIEIGDYWGTVQQVGLRSTRILTPRKETVIVPNKIMEEREIWNYTLFSSEFRLDIDVPIAYDADWREAERMLLEVAREHPNTLSYRPAAVMMRSFGESAVNLQLRCWIADVTVRAETMSDLLKTIKDKFDEAHVEIPLPHRVVLQRKELPPSAPRKPLQPYTRFSRIRRRILVAVADPQAAHERSLAIVSIAKALEAGIVAVFIPEHGDHRQEGEQGLRAIADAAREQRIWCKPLIRPGDTVETLRHIAQTENVDLVLIGTSHRRLSNAWRREPDLGEQIQKGLDRPVFTLPHEGKVRPDLIAAMKKEIERFRGATNGQSEAQEQPPSPGSN